MQIVPDEYSQRHPGEDDIHVGQVLSWGVRPDGELKLLFGGSGTQVARAVLTRKREPLIEALWRLGAAGRPGSDS